MPASGPGPLLCLCLVHTPSQNTFDSLLLQGHFSEAFLDLPSRPLSLSTTHPVLLSSENVSKPESAYLLVDRLPCSLEAKDSIVLM